MADIWYDVDTALAEVPVNLMPLIDDTDFKTIEGAVAYNAAGMALYWHFVTSAGAYTLTAVTPTTAGNYDWTDQGAAGIYTIEIPASGGASINNDTEGYGWFTGVATGVLPWRGPICGFRAAAINDSLCDAGSTGLLSPTTAARTLDVSAGGEAGVDWANVGSPTTAVNLSATNIGVDQVVASVSGAVGSVTGAVGSVTGAVGSVTGAVGSVTGNVGGNVVGSVASVTGAVGSVTGNVGGNVTGSVGSVATGGIVAGSFAADAITAAKIAADVTTELQSGLATAANLATLQTTADAILVDTGTTLPATLDTIDNFLDTEIAAILADTNELQTDWANGGRLDLLLDNAAAGGAAASFGIVHEGTAQSATGTTLVLASGAAFANDELIGATILITGGTGVGQARTITDYVGSTDTATVDTWTTTPSGTITYKVFGTPPASATAVPAVNLVQVAGSTTDVSALATNVAAILVDTGTTLDTKLNTIDDFLDTEVAAILADTNELQTDWANGGRLDLILDSAASAGDPWGTALPGAYGAGTAGKIIGDNINATISSRASQTSVDTVDDLLDTEVAAIKTVVDAVKVKTDSLTFTQSGQVDANIQYVNDVALVGDGSATPWGPA